MARKLKLIISDFHVGTGKHLPDGRTNVGEDFFHDENFVEMLGYYMKMYSDGGDVELIINGDFLNFIYVGYRGTYPIDVTEKISLEKLQNILDAHPEFFDVLSRFSRYKGFRISYVIGNHDMDMVWPKCQELFKKRIGADVTFYTLYYKFDSIHVEHGNRFELFNKFDHAHPIISKGVKEPVLNQSFGSFFVTMLAAPLKRAKPHIDKIKPFRMFLILDLVTHFRSAIKVWVKFFLYFAAMLFSAYQRRYPAIRSTLQIIINGVSMYPNIERGARELLRSHSDIHTVIFGHNHVAKVLQFKDKKRYLNSGTWNEITSFDLAQFGKSEQKTYIEISYPEDEKLQPTTELKVWLGPWSPIRTMH